MCDALRMRLRLLAPADFGPPDVCVCVCVVDEVRSARNWACTYTHSKCECLCVCASRLLTGRSQCVCVWCGLDGSSEHTYVYFSQLDICMSESVVVIMHDLVLVWPE